MTDHDDQRPSSLANRRAVLLGAGAVGALGVLAACGTDTPTANGPGPLPSQPDVPKAAIKTADIPVGGGKIYAEQTIVVTQPAPGTFKAFDAICQHQGCVVSSVANGRIVCQCHNSQYNIADGSVVQGPATKGLPAKTVSVSGDSIIVS